MLKPGDEILLPLTVEEFCNYNRHAVVLKFKMSEGSAAHITIPVNELPELDGGNPTETLLNEREKTHGDFRENALRAQMFKSLFRAAPNWMNMRPIQKEALDNIATKLARLLCGNHNDPEHVRDISGYCQLVLRSLEEKTK